MYPKKRLAVMGRRAIFLNRKYPTCEKQNKQNTQANFFKKSLLLKAMCRGFRGGLFHYSWCNPFLPAKNSKCLLLPMTCKSKLFCAASLVVQWLRIRLPMQGTRVRALVQEDPTCRRATKPLRHNYWACAPEPTSRNYWSLRASATKEATARRSPRTATKSSPSGSSRQPKHSNEDPTQPKINK